MRRKNRPILLSLPAQWMLVLVILVLLAASAIGIPSIWLVRQQLDRQAQELVDQGSRMVAVLLDGTATGLSNLAILTAQRPTLAELLDLGDPDRLDAYLETLRAGADLDAIMICSTVGEPLAQVGLPLAAQACQASPAERVFRSPPGETPPAWLLSSQPVPSDPSFFVITGQALDENFSAQLRTQSGMEHLFLYNGELLEGSFPQDARAWEAMNAQRDETSPPENPGSTFTLDGIPYFAARSPYQNTGLETIVLLPGTLITETQQRLTRTITAAIVLVTLVCSLAAIFLARQVSLPLVRLRDSAIALRKGDLTTPVTATTQVNEIAQVAYALEDARVALRGTLEELRQEKAWADHLLESVAEGIITLDSQGRITFFSRGAERITGWTQEQVLGKPADDVFPLTDRGALFSQRLPAPGARQEIMSILARGRTVTLAVTGAALAPPEAGKASLALSIRDISNEEAMRGLLGDFLANVTHEFRTPLTALAVSIELLLDQLDELSTAELHELLVSNRLGVLSLQNLIDNLLEGASIEAGRFRVSPRPVDLEEVIQEAARIMQPLMDKNRQTLELEVPPDLPPVRADPRRTTQVLVNLLSNAVKWSPRDSAIQLLARAGEGMVKVQVADQGPGISPEHKQDLFVRFAHVQSADRRAEHGAGLGLSVVKAIVESQNGCVGVEDRPGGGAVFWFTVPAIHPAAGDEEAEL
jgi:PAS domain S-box-containing protein